MWKAITDTSCYVTACPKLAGEKERRKAGEHDVCLERGLKQAQEPHPDWRHYGWLSTHTTRHGPGITLSLSLLSTLVHVQ